MKKISILLPTRGRPASVYRLFESIEQTTSKLNELEVVLYIDEDDIASHEISYSGIDIVKLIRPPGNSMGNILRESYKASTGRYVMLMNDDAIFCTWGWDLRILESFSRFPDDIALVYGNDLDQQKRVCTFPILSRNACELMGGVCPAEYLNLHIESHLLDIFNQLKTLGHERIVYLDDVLFVHLHYAVGKSKFDKTYKKKDPGFDDWQFISFADERIYIARRLAKYIEEQKSIRASLGKNIDRNKAYHNKPVVSIILPFFNTDIDSFMNSIDTIINECSNQTPFELIVIAGVTAGVTDELPSYLLSIKEKIRVVHTGERSCLSRIYNEGVEETRGDFLIYLKSGDIPKSVWIDVLVKTAKTEKDVGVVGCKLLNSRNGRIHHAGISFFKHNGKLKLTHIYRGFRADNPVVNKPREFQAVGGGCLMIKKEVFVDINGFDEALDYTEDIDLCLRVRAQGMRVIYTPKAVIYHSDRAGEFYGYENNFHHTSHIDDKWMLRIDCDLGRLLEEDGFSLCKNGKNYYLSPK